MYVYTCLSVCLLVCLSVCLSQCLSVYPCLLSAKTSQTTGLRSNRQPCRPCTVIYTTLSIDQFETSTSHPQAFELLKSLLVKLPAPGTRLLVKYLAMWKDLCSNVPARFRDKKKISKVCADFTRLIQLTHKTAFV